MSADERLAIEAMAGAARLVPAGAELVGDGEASADCLLLLDGQAFRHKTLPDGRRQILGFHTPGDVLDLQRLFLGVDYGVTALTSCRVAAVPGSKLTEALIEHPRLAHALWRMSLVEASIQREWMVGMGRKSAYARVAHLLCEMFIRLRACGLTNGERCRFPATQAHLADAVGLSQVHLNRVLQQLRSARLAAFRARELLIMDWTGLAAAGDFDGQYLHLPARTVAPPPPAQGPTARTGRTTQA
ncbi:MAG: Crp/Fnr family transcriptional regulator [Pseudomonadota bacterium]